jgi:hypothetical protein
MRQLQTKITKQERMIARLIEQLPEEELAWLSRTAANKFDERLKQLFPTHLHLSRQSKCLVRNFCVFELDFRKLTRTR